MEENRIPKNVLYINLETTSVRGIPRNRWQDEVRKVGKLAGGMGGGKEYTTDGSGRCSCERQGIVAFCTSQCVDERMNSSILLSMTVIQMATSLQLFLLQWCMNFSSLKSVVCLQQWVKHELRPLLSLHKLTIATKATKGINTSKKEPQILPSPPHKT